MPEWLFPRFRSFWYGLTLPLAAARLILSKPSLMIWAALPVAITVALYTFLIRALQSGAKDLLVRYFASWGWNPDGWAAWGLMVLTQLVLLLVGALTFSFVASIAASPFNDLLAEVTERWSDPPLPPVSKSSWKMKIQLIGVDLAKAVAATAAGVIAILFSWVPILNVAAFVIAFLLITFQYISYPQTRRGLGMKPGLLFLLRHLFACAGFGMSIAFLFSLPLISTVALPLAVVGGTLLVGRAPGLQGRMRPLK